MPNAELAEQEALLLMKVIDDAIENWQRVQQEVKQDPVAMHGILNAHLLHLAGDLLEVCAITQPTVDPFDVLKLAVSKRIRFLQECLSHG